MSDNIEERNYTDCGDGCELVWRIEDGVEKVYFQFDDGDTDMICETDNYREAEIAYNNSLIWVFLLIK